MDNDIIKSSRETLLARVSEQEAIIAQFEVAVAQFEVMVAQLRATTAELQKRIDALEKRLTTRGGPGMPGNKPTSTTTPHGPVDPASTQRIL